MKGYKEFIVMVSEMMKAQSDLKEYIISGQAVIDGEQLEDLQKAKAEKEEAVINEIYENLYPLKCFENE